MEIQNLILGLIVFTMFSVGGVALISMFQEHDSTMVDADKFHQFNSTFNQYEKTIQLSTDIQDSVMNITATPSGGVMYYLDILGTLMMGVWNTFLLVLSSVGFILTMIVGLGMFGVPAWVTALIIAGIVVALVFAIIRAITKTQV